MGEVTPVGALGRGLAAGLAGTATMTAWQELSARLMQRGSGQEEQEESEEQGEPEGQEAQPDPWESASAPAKVARRVIEGVFRRHVPPERIGLLTNVMHWAYGTSWGAAFGIAAGTVPGRRLRGGLLFGSGVWAMSYVMLVPMGLYEPPWRYSPSELALDLSYHLAYGAGTGVAYALMEG